MSKRMKKRMTEAQAAEIANDALPSVIAIIKDEDIGDWTMTNCGWPIMQKPGGETRHFDSPKAALEFALGWYMKGNKKISEALKQLAAV